MTKTAPSMANMELAVLPFLPVLLPEYISLSVALGVGGRSLSLPQLYLLVSVAGGLWALTSVEPESP